MICNRIPLTGDDSYLDTYVLDDGEYDRKGRKHHAMIVCPGGGYSYCSKNEGEPSFPDTVKTACRSFLIRQESQRRVFDR